MFGRTRSELQYLRDLAKIPMWIKIGLEFQFLEEKSFPVYKSGAKIPVCGGMRVEFQCLEG